MNNIIPERHRADAPYMLGMLPNEPARIEWRESRRIKNIALRRGWMHVARLWRKALSVKRMYEAIDKARASSRIAWKDYGRLS